MREIKFRAWDKELKLMILPSNNFQKDYIDLTISGIIIDSCVTNKPTKKYLLMQYIGLKDKNNKEIYEGDIVKYYKAIFEVKMKDGAWNCAIIHQDGCEYSSITTRVEIEVIGNIYENPELLEK